MIETVAGRDTELRTLVATTAGLGGLIAFSSAVGYDAVVETDSDSAWRDLLGPLGSISLLAALGAVALGMTAVLMGERRPRRVAVAATGAALGLLALAYWLWVIEGILDTT
jgi:hypothetical protein